MIETRQCWTNGPLRQWFKDKTKSGLVKLASGGYAGQYICDQCGLPVNGLYFSRRKAKWICPTCRYAK
jgi:hypothetical protein